MPMRSVSQTQNWKSNVTCGIIYDEIISKVLTADNHTSALLSKPTTINIFVINKNLQSNEVITLDQTF